MRAVSARHIAAPSAGTGIAATSWMPNRPSLLLVREVADLLRTSTKAVYAMIERRALPGVVRVGRRVLVRQDVLLDWLHQESAPSPKE
jgi:excisionase family DNA binding protein